MSIGLSVSLSVRLSLCLCVSVCVCLSACLYACPPVCLSVCLHFSLRVSVAMLISESPSLLFLFLSFFRPSLFPSFFSAFFLSVLSCNFFLSFLLYSSVNLIHSLFRDSLTHSTILTRSSHPSIHSSVSSFILSSFSAADSSSPAKKHRRNKPIWFFCSRKRYRNLCFAYSELNINLARLCASATCCIHTVLHPLASFRSLTSYISTDAILVLHKVNAFSVSRPRFPSPFFIDNSLKCYVCRTSQSILVSTATLSVRIRWN